MRTLALMKSRVKLFTSLLLASLLAAATSAAAGELVLRPHSVPTGAIVRVSDIADATTLDDAARRRLLDIPLMPAPAPGAQQRLSASQVRDLLAANGVDAADLRIAGAEAVVIEGPARAIEPAPAARQNSQPLTSEVAEEQLVAQISQFLRQQTGHELWNISVEPNAPLVEAFRRGAARPTVSGGKAPYTGRQRFTFAFAGDKDALAAVAQVEQLQIVACAVRTIERGDFVRATDVVLRPIGGAVPAQAVASLDAAVGQEAVQTIRTDAVILANQLRAPIIVRRGERVTVKARAAGVVVRTYATAREDGALGDLIMVEALEGRERYAARVSGARELEVFAAGAAAGEIAATTHESSAASHQIR